MTRKSKKSSRRKQERRRVRNLIYANPWFIITCTVSVAYFLAHHLFYPTIPKPKHKTVALENQTAGDAVLRLLLPFSYQRCDYKSLASNDPAYSNRKEPDAVFIEEKQVCSLDEAIAYKSDSLPTPEESISPQKIVIELLDTNCQRISINPTKTPVELLIFNYLNKEKELTALPFGAQGPIQNLEVEEAGKVLLEDASLVLLDSETEKELAIDYARFSALFEKSLQFADQAMIAMYEPQIVQELPLKSNKIPAAAEEEIPVTTLEEEEEEGYPFYGLATRSSLILTEGDSIGSCSGYLTLGLQVAPIIMPDEVYPTVDLRGHHFFDGTNALNAGMGVRHLLANGDIFWGVNAFYDYREGKYANFRRVGAGLEVQGQSFAGVVNFYLPVGVQKNLHLASDYQYAGGYFYKKYVEQQELGGGDLELGWNISSSKDFSFYLGAGPYYLHGQQVSGWGGFTRIRNSYREFVFAEAIASVDSIFDSNYSIKIGLSIPLGQFSSKYNPKDPDGRDNPLYRPIRRLEIIPLITRTSVQKNF